MVLGVTTAAVLASAVVDAAESFPWGCMFRAVTGIPCPSCGMTHAFVAMGHGRVAEAFAHNLFGPVLYGAVVLVGLLAGTQLLAGRELMGPLWLRTRRAVLVVVLPSMMAAWIAHFV